MDDDDDDDHGIEHLRHNIRFLNKKQGRMLLYNCQVIVVPQGTTRMVKIEKRKSRENERI